MLVDTRASVDILYWDAFVQLGLPPAILQPYPGKLVSFSGDEVDVAGVIALPMTIGEGEVTRTEDIEFTVVRLLSTYNMIMGRVSLC